MAKKAAEKDTEEETEKPAAAPAPGYASLPVAYAASLQQHYAQHASQSTQQAPGDANARAYQSYQVAQYNAALAASQPPRPKPKGKDANNPHQRHGRWTEEEEKQLTAAEAVRFAEMEGERQISSSPPAIMEKYKEDMSQFVENLRGKLASVSAEFESLRSDRDLGHALRRFLGVRNRKA